MLVGARASCADSAAGALVFYLQLFAADHGVDVRITTYCVSAAPRGAPPACGPALASSFPCLVCVLLGFC